MSGDPFASGPGGSSAKITEFEGKLLLLYVKEYLSGENAVKTQDFGEKDVIVADVHDVESGRVEHGVYVFQGRLIGALKRHVGKKPYLARLGKGKEKVKGNYPWEFSDPTAKDKKIAVDYIESLKSDEDSPFA